MNTTVRTLSLALLLAGLSACSEKQNTPPRSRNCRRPECRARRKKQRHH